MLKTCKVHFEGKGVVCNLKMTLYLTQCAMLSRHERNNKFSDTGPQPQTGSNGLTELRKSGHNAYWINQYNILPL